MHFDIPESLRKLAALFSEEGCVLFAVGGMVRNTLLGIPVSDMDITSAMRPDRVLALCARHNLKTVNKGIDFGMVEIHIDGDSYEHTTFRSDNYCMSGAHRPDSVRFSDDIEVDAHRRDFTVNAMYYNLVTNEVCDPTHGMKDLEEKLMRATSTDPSDIMGDDALRIMRLVRFCSELGFSPEKHTFEAARANVDKLADISGERVRDELDKIILSDVRYPIAHRASPVYGGLYMLDALGALELILPEVTRGRFVTQSVQYHRYDVMEHLMHTCAQSSPTLVLRLTGLLHDIGKPEVKRETGTMYDHERRGAVIANKVLERLKYPNSVKQTVCCLIENHMFDLTGTAKDSTVRLRLASLGRERARLLIAVRTADVLGSGYETEAPTAKRFERVLCEMESTDTPFSTDELNCTGTDIMEWLGIPPSKELGTVKQRLFEHCVRHPADNRKEKLKILARGMTDR